MDDVFDVRAVSKLGCLNELYFDYDYTQETIHWIRMFHEMSARSVNAHLMLLYGEPGSGKSTVIQRYMRMMKNEEGENQLFPRVIKVTLLANCTAKALLSSLLNGLNDPLADKGSLFNMADRAVEYIKRKRISLIIVDEFQHLIDRKRRAVSYSAADQLKGIVEKLDCPFLLVGMPSTQRVLDENEQLERRVFNRVELKRLPMNNRADLNRVRQLLAFFAQEYPFVNAEMLVDEELARRIHKASEGLIGRMVRLLQLAGGIAIMGRSSTIEVQHFFSAFSQLQSEEKAALGKMNPFGKGRGKA